MNFGNERNPVTNAPLLLIRLGSGLVGLALLFSLWASPDRIRSLPWFIIAMVGVALVLCLTGRWLPAIARKTRPAHIVWFFLSATVVALGAALLTSRWPAYKLSWLNAIYAALPSIRSLPLWWTQQGLQPNQTGGILAVFTSFSAAIALAPPWNSVAASSNAGSHRRRWPVAAHRWSPALLTAAGLMVVFMTGSRAALAGVIAAIVMIIILQTRRWLWAWGTTILLLCLGLYASGQLTRIFDFFLRDETLDTKLVARLDIWSSTLKGIEDHLLSGIGLGVFNQVMPVRYPYQTVGLSYPVSQAHNFFLDIALAIGLPGLLGLLLLLLGCLMITFKGLQHENPLSTLCTGLLASIVAFLIFGLTDSISLSIPTSFVIWIWGSALAIVHVRLEVLREAPGAC